MQLPEDSVEALCIHEPTHNLEDGHGIELRNKMIGPRGEKAFKRDQDLFYKGKWHYLKF
ncbi:MAG: hypothetical protein J6J06_01485 [Bacteroidaceae bacterium]|nr:hypothetical protein [Bacteroidaceae bacterium]